MPTPAVSVLIVTHDSATWIEACLASLAAGAGALSHEVIVCDNASTDGTPDLVARVAPGTRVVRQPNRGFGAGVNRAAREASGEVLVALNPDTVVEPHAIAWLAAAATPGTIATATVTLLDDPARVNTCGLDLHFTGLASVRGLLDPAEQWASDTHPGGFSGAAFAIRREDFVRLGGFDEAFFLYLEDAELAWRARRAGFGVVHVGEARIRHDYRPRPTPPKLAWVEEGRLLLLRRHLRWWQWLAYAPSLFAVEMLAWGQALRLGPHGLAAKGRALRRGWRRLPPQAPSLGGPLSLGSFATRSVDFRALGAGRALRILLAPFNWLFWLNTLAWRGPRGARRGGPPGEGR